MKKTISLLLALVLCLFLCACDGGEQNENTQPNSTNSNQSESMSAQNTPTDIVEQELSIVGEWLLANSTSEQTLIINEDGTGLYSTKNSTTELTWKYDADLKCYTLAVGEIVSAFVKEEDGVEQLLIGTNIFVHSDDYESAHAEYLAEYLAEKAQEEIDDAKAYKAAQLEGKIPLEYGTTYQISEDFEIAVVDAEFATYTTSNGDIVGLWLTIELTNLTDSDISWHNSPFIDMVYTCIYPSTSHGMFDFAYNIGEDGNQVKKYPAHDTVRMKLPISDWTNTYNGTGKIDVYEVLDASIDKYGYIMGYSSFVFGEVEYYIDLADIPVNG